MSKIEFLSIFASDHHIMTLPFLFIGAAEVGFIIFIVVLVFGADKVPEITRGLAKGLKTIRNATNDIKTEITNSAEEHFGEEGAAKDIKDEVNKVKKEIEEVTGSIKRKNPFR